MNRKAEQHLTRAREYVQRGEEFYRKAAVEIQAALNEGATQRECAERMGKAQSWVSTTLNWYLRNDRDRESPFGGDTPANQASRVAAAKRVLRESPELLLDTPGDRANVSKALDRHYRQRATEAAEKRREREVEDRGGEESYEEQRREMRVAEVVNVARGGITPWRFVAFNVRDMGLEPDDPAAREILRLAGEARAFLEMVEAYLVGGTLTDDDLARLLEA